MCHFNGILETKISQKYFLKIGFFLRKKNYQLITVLDLLDSSYRFPIENFVAPKTYN